MAGHLYAPGERQKYIMICPICGKENPDGATFCAGCGNSMVPQAPVAPAAPIIPQQPAPQAQPQQQYAQPQQQYAQPQYAQPQQQYAAPAAAPANRPAGPSFGDYFKSLFNAAIKPATGCSEEVKKYERIGHALILTAIVVGILTILSFTSSVITTTIGQYWPSTNVGVMIRLITRFFSPLVHYALRTAGFAGIMVLIGLITKEKWSFPRMLAISSMAIFPAEVVDLVLYDILSSISIASTVFNTLMKIFPLTTILSSAASIYAFIIMYEGITQESKLTGNKKVFVYVIAYVVLAFVSRYISLVL